MTVAADDESAIELISEVPRAARAGDRISCEWQLTNRSDAPQAASFYLRTTPALLAALTCQDGKVIRGYRHGSVLVCLRGGEATKVRALLDVRSRGKQGIRVAIVTRNEVSHRLDLIEIGPPERSLW